MSHNLLQEVILASLIETKTILVIMPQRKYEEDPKLMMLVQQTVIAEMNTIQAIENLKLSGYEISKKKYQRIKKRLETFDPGFMQMNSTFDKNLQLTKLETFSKNKACLEKIRDTSKDERVKIKAVMELNKLLDAEKNYTHNALETFSSVRM